MKRRNPVVHFELPASDSKQLADFYSNTFGWGADFLGEEMGNYVTVSTSETDQNGVPARPGSINGGLFPKGQGASDCPSLVISVDDIHEHIGLINKAGGAVLGEPTDIPGVGSFVSFRDPSGNICSILQPIMPMGEKQQVEQYGATGEI